MKGKCFIVISEWDIDSGCGESFGINGIFINQKDAIDKFNDVIKTEELNCPWLTDTTECDIEHTETEYKVFNHAKDRWFEVRISEHDIE